MKIVSTYLNKRERENKKRKKNGQQENQSKREIDIDVTASLLTLKINSLQSVEIRRTQRVAANRSTVREYHLSTENKEKNTEREIDRERERSITNSDDNVFNSYSCSQAYRIS